MAITHTESENGRQHSIHIGNKQGEHTTIMVMDEGCWTLEKANRPLKLIVIYGVIKIKKRILYGSKRNVHFIPQWEETEIFIKSGTASFMFMPVA